MQIACKTASVVNRRPSELASRGFVQANGSLNQGDESLLVDRVVLFDVDGAPYFPLKARVEESRGVVQRGALEERELDHALVRLAGADPTVVRPHRHAWIGRLSPLPLLDHIRVRLLDQAAHSGQGLTTPVAEFLDLRVDQVRGRLAVFRGAVRHRWDVTGRSRPCTGGTAWWGLPPCHTGACAHVPRCPRSEGGQARVD